MTAYRCEHEPRLAGSSETGLVACHDGGRVLLFALDDLDQAGEVALAAGAEVDLGFAGARLLVLSRGPDGATVHAIDPHKLRVVATASVDSAARLLACNGPHALFAGKNTLLVLTVDGDELRPQSIPTRTAPTAAAVLADGRVLLNVGGHVETWDLELRRPLHRIRSDRQLTAQFLGGAREQIWMIPAARTSHLDVLPLDGRAAWSRPVEGPVVAAAGLTGGDALVLASAAGAPEVVSLARRDAPGSSLSQPAASALWIGGGDPAVLVTAARGEPLRSWSLSASGGRVTAVPRATTDVGAPVASTPAAETPPPPPLEEAPRATPVPASSVSVSDRLREWRERLRPASTTRPPLIAAAASHAAWRDGLVSWARAHLARTGAEPPPWDEQSSVARAAARLELPVGASRGLALLYAAHLLGAHPTRAELAAAIGSGEDAAWEEALGHGALGRSGIARWSRRGVRLVDEVAVALDDLPARHARMIVGPEGALLSLAGPCAVIASSDGEVLEVAERAAVTLGATIAILDRDHAPLAEALLEARVRGAVPLFAPLSPVAGPWLDELGAALVAVPAPLAGTLGIPLLF